MEHDRGREDFLTEAQDIIESFSQNLLAIDAGHKRGELDPTLVNEAFRAMKAGEVARTVLMMNQ